MRSGIGALQLGKKIEQRIINSQKSFYTPPIFIIGLPRSGSTLLYQLLTNYLKVSYFSNLSAFFYAYPATITYLTLPFHKKFKLKNFESNLGFTSGLFAPSEAGAIYRYWFDGPSKPYDVIKNTSNKISDLLMRPFVWKNLNLSYEVTSLIKIFPDALFVLIERELEYICQSVYRRTIDGPGMGIKGLTKAELINSFDMMEAIVNNIKNANKYILETINNAQINLIKIKYTELCKNYSGNLERILRHYTKIGYQLEKKLEFCHHKFTVDNFKKLSDSEWYRLNNLLQKTQL